MRNRTLWLGLALVAGLALVGWAVAEPGGKAAAGGKGGCAADKGLVGLDKGGFGDKAAAGKGDKAAPGKGDFAKGDKAAPGKGGPGKGDKAAGGKGGPGKGGPGKGVPGNRGVNVDEIVDRLVSFDKNKDNKVVKDELPERMQDLIAKGDSNKDGSLDKDEIRTLATTLSRDASFRGFDGAAAPGGRGGPPTAGRGPGPRRGGAEAAVDDLNLTDKKKESAEAALKAHQENVRKLMDLARADLLLKMKEVLSEQEYKTFKENLERQPAPPQGGPPRGGRP